MRHPLGSKRRGLPKDLPKGYSWEDRVCDSCKFCIDDDCRESPPCIEHNKYADSGFSTYYPTVKGYKACSKYKPKEAPNAN